MLLLLLPRLLLHLLRRVLPQQQDSRPAHCGERVHQGRVGGESPDVVERGQIAPAASAALPYLPTLLTLLLLLLAIPQSTPFRRRSALLPRQHDVNVRRKEDAT